MSHLPSIDPDLSHSRKQKRLLTPGYLGTWMILGGIVLMLCFVLSEGDNIDREYLVFSPPIIMGVGILLGAYLQKRRR